MESHKLSVKRILIDLLSIKDQLKMLFNNNTEYATLINFLTEKDYYNDDDIPLPSLKEIESKTGLKTNQLRNQLLNIYQELFEYDSNKTLEFNNKEYFFFLEFNKTYASFTLKNINHLPRIGENITIPFLKAKIQLEVFYVEDIRHEFTGTSQRIEIYLKSGYFNSYFHFRKHQALEENEIGILEIHDMTDYQIKERLRMGRFKYNR
ncbi:hypothetical protein [Flavobacterium muglaense]|uniref:Uncharacterized protein n=1 Tax=Flavobacterium muglaense TaxID=2764716 RepID=A0A923MW23_9FLAO|nr:hypothetical protein [Flavobacterium muglaense]MBC5836732.1 hypothetical protein [Flavobacterium muglaense]MBC5843318.1 hypothetical protein [Flavobacterium muglaense]